LAIYQKLSNQDGIADVLYKLGWVYQKLKQEDKGVLNTVQSLALYEKIGNQKYIADALNNLGVVFYEGKNFGKAIKYYKKAIAIRAEMASYYSNLGAALFSKKEFEKATEVYAKALELDPDIFERTSRTGVAAQLPSPEDRARYEYVMARLYAKMGRTDDSLQCLRKALEQGYKDINMVYKDAEFSDLRKNPRFIELMAAKPPAIQE